MKTHLLKILFFIILFSVTNNNYAQLTITEAHQDCECFGDCTGNIDITASGGTPPYFYSIDNGVTFKSNGLFENICAETYYIIAKDNNGFDTSIVIVITEPDPRIITDSISNSTNSVCNGYIEIDVTGGSNSYTYYWNTGGGYNFIENLCAGLYEVIVDDLSCAAVQDSFYIENTYDSSYTFIDTISVTIDTCVFNTALPVDSAFIYNFKILSSDSAVLYWEFWQAGSSIFLNVRTTYTNGTNLIYLEINCTNKSTSIYDFYGVFKSTGTDVNEIANITSVSIYPNPVTDYLNIKLNSKDKGLAKLYLLDITGKVIISKNFKNEIQLDIHKMNKGVYLIKIDNNSSIITRMIIIE